MEQVAWSVHANFELILLRTNNQRPRQEHDILSKAAGWLVRQCKAQSGCSGS
jgi:hypothetical protein